MAVKVHKETNTTKPRSASARRFEVFLARVEERKHNEVAVEYLTKNP